MTRGADGEQCRSGKYTRNQLVLLPNHLSSAVAPILEKRLEMGLFGKNSPRHGVPQPLPRHHLVRTVLLELRENIASKQVRYAKKGPWPFHKRYINQSEQLAFSVRDSSLLLHFDDHGTRIDEPWSFQSANRCVGLKQQPA